VSKCDLETSTIRWSKPSRLVEPWRKRISLYSYNNKKNNHAPGKEREVTEIAVKNQTSWEGVTVCLQPMKLSVGVRHNRRQTNGQPM
jgi:hypothetical protein